MLWHESENHIEVRLATSSFLMRTLRRTAPLGVVSANDAKCQSRGVYVFSHSDNSYSYKA